MVARASDPAMAVDNLWSFGWMGARRSLDSPSGLHNVDAIRSITKSDYDPAHSEYRFLFGDHAVRFRSLILWP